VRALYVTHLDVPQGVIATVPVGSVEQHGPHLPLGTDSLIAQWLGDELERLFPERILLYPLIPITCSIEHSGFRGVAYVNYSTMLRYLNDLIRSMAQWGAGGIVLINAHGGNTEVINLVAKEWNYKVREPKVLGYSVYNPNVTRKIRELFGEFGHADAVETSMVASIREDLVRLDRVREVRRRVDMNTARVIELSEDGVMGSLSPSSIDPNRGRELLKFILEDLVGKMRERFPI